MRHIRSADPWSSFLEPDERAAAPAHYLDPGRAEPHPAAHAGAIDGELPATSRRVMMELSSAHGELTVEELHDRSGLTLLEVADAVRELHGRGLVGLSREQGDEVVRAMGAGHAGSGG